MTGRGLRVEWQKELPVVYRDVHLDCGYRLDLLDESQILLELKAVDSLLSIPEAQLLSSLKLSHWKVGLLIHFNVRMLTNGFKRVVNNY